LLVSSTAKIKRGSFPVHRRRQAKAPNTLCRRIKWVLCAPAHL